MPTKSRQTKGLSELFRLPGLVVSPYYQAGWGNLKTTYMPKALVTGYTNSGDGGSIAASFMLWNSSGSFVGYLTEDFTIALTDTTTAQIKASIIAGVIAGALPDGGVTLVSSNVFFMSDFFNGSSYSTPSLAVNTARQASVNQRAFVSASVDITATLSLITGQTGKVTLQYADNSAFTTNVVSLQPSSNGNTGSLTLGLNLGQIVTATVTGIIPEGKYYRLLTTNITGTPTYGTPVIQEVLL